MTRVLAVAQFTPEVGRVETALPEGLTLAEIVAQAVPGLADPRMARVALVTDRYSEIVPPEMWHRVRPRPGVRVVVRVLAGNDGLRSVLQIVVSITALVVAPMLGGVLATTFGLTPAVAQGIAGLGITLVGNLAINALIPPPKDERPQNRYTISGWRNRLDPNGAVPQVLGTVRHAPPFAARSYTEIVGDWQYVRALFTFGIGPVVLSDLRLGETPLDEYQDVEVEIREGRPDDTRPGLYPRQVVEEAVGAQLIRPLRRDASGEELDPPQSDLQPVVRTTGPDARGVGLVLSFPGGLVRIKKNGKSRERAVTLRIEQRLVTDEAWTLWQDVTIRGRRLEMFWRYIEWEFPSRGRWQVRLTMLTEEPSENDDDRISQNLVWVALQTLRPEYPLNFQHPLSLVALRIRATHQLNGQLDNFSAVASSLCLDWDHEQEEWVERASSNPAALFRHVLQAPSNIRPVPDSGIDLVALQDWHDFCRIRNLRYDAVQDQASTSLRDVLTEIAAAGRAAPRHDGLRWSVVVDRPADLPVVEHVGPRNSREFRWSRQYVRPPHAVRVAFLDASNDYQPAERIVRWPGYDGPIDVTEALPLPGKVHADEVWREARRRMYEILHRADAYQCIQDGAVRIATRGDLIAHSHFVLDQTQAAARVRGVEGATIRLDDLVTLIAGQDHAISFRAFDGPGDQVGTAVVRPVAPGEGETQILTLTGEGPMPVAGDLIHFGLAGRVDRHLIVRGIESGEDQSAVLHLIDRASQIDEIVDAEVPPVWSGRVGDDVSGTLPPPTLTAPRFVGVTSEIAGAEGQRTVAYRIEPGAGSGFFLSYEVAHRLASSGDWTTQTIWAFAGGGTITGYLAGNAIVLRARALPLAGSPGPWSAELAYTVGTGELPVPGALDAASVTVTPLLGGALVQFATGPDAATDRVQVYRSTSSTLNRATDAAGPPIPVSPLSSHSAALGDTNRVNLIVNGGFDSGAAWTMDTGWAIAAGVATHSPGDAGTIGQPITALAGQWLRLGYRVEDRTAGTLTPRLTGDWETLTVNASGDVTVTQAGWYDYVLVGGGGGGGARAGGGGGGGRVLTGTIWLEPGVYPAVIGAGGAGQTHGGAINPGGASSFADLTAPGGGGGYGGAGNANGGDGANGGGGGGTGNDDTSGGTASAGGNAGGGGRGASGGSVGGGGGSDAAVGQNGTASTSGGDGADGVITWAGQFGAGGGGGTQNLGSAARGRGGAGGGGDGGGSSNTNGANATANTGSGGGGATSTSATPSGGNGAAGTLRLRRHQVVATGAPVSTDTLHLDRIVATGAADRIEWVASSAFDGSLDDAFAYVETAACLAQGTHFIWLEPQNGDGIPGPVLGPIEITII